ncbi:hypothetical protein JY651_32230 [Pyxidicoccus parkwayensis]|uniref:Com family DNA-binding transcriptional regulator n=1 Tax=Pyxidicoccus parkwayensis TaxID=2813578 RepID=A0ABX7PDU2_9BACT|nr:hypothetical protein [Pyxidicoccus parkwaysis]QSQ28623.1 hypothetical protein JY651_32230 [Pyxidicoccus parkwaysis]
MREGCQPEGGEGELRCLCGSLLARLVPGGVELKCRRCHRTRVVPLEGGAGGGRDEARGARRERAADGEARGV